MMNEKAKKLLQYAKENDITVEELVLLAREIRELLEEYQPVTMRVRSYAELGI
jgi:flagellar biosynthesis protein FlhB